MIAAVTQSLTTDSLPINWFDGALLALLVFGIFRGRKNGLTKEIVPTIQWLLVVVVAGLAYAPLADIYTHQCGMNKLWGALSAYMSIAVVIFLIFSGIKKAVRTRVESGCVFGNAEYYLGMPTGMIRYACMIMFGLALLNARSYTSAEIAAKKAYDERWYGGGIYSGDYMPDLRTAQDSIFKKSLTGPYIQNYLAMLLIQTGPGEGGAGTDVKKPQPVIHIGN